MKIIKSSIEKVETKNNLENRRKNAIINRKI